MGFSYVVSVDCGQYYSAILTMNKLYLLGSNMRGQLSTQEQNTHYNSLSLDSSTLSDRVKSVHCGWSTTHLLYENGDLKGWGRNEYGQIGNSRECLTMDSGSEHSVAIQRNGKVITWGWNEHGNCGTGKVSEMSLKSTLEVDVNSVKMIACGNGHSFVVTSSV